MKKALILDRDGTLIEDQRYLNNYKKIYFLKNNIRGLKLFQKSNFTIFIVSNQSGVARKLIKKKELNKINTEIKKKLKLNGIIIKKIFNCIHLPENNCKCRKPKKYFGEIIFKNLSFNKKKSIMIGNNYCDFKFAKNLKIKYYNMGTGTKDFKSVYSVAREIL
jgi:D-glycero-D-manno-heptose 1,7-bisphosphate phosphatase